MSAFEIASTNAGFFAPGRARINSTAHPRQTLGARRAAGPDVIPKGIGLMPHHVGVRRTRSVTANRVVTHSGVMDISESMNREMQSEDVAFEAMYQRHFRHVLAYCGRRLPSSEAPDAASDTFLVAWRRFDEMPSGDGERPWLYGVAYRVVSNQRRSTGRRRRLNDRLRMVDRPRVEDAAVQVVQADADRMVLAAIAQLDATDQEVIRLSLWEELSSPEVANALGISEAAVRKRKSRARRRLQRILEPEQEQGIVIPIAEAEGEAP